MTVSDESVAGHVRQVAGDLWRNGRGWTLLAISAGWFLSLGVRVTYPALLPFLRSEFGISLTTAGFLVTVLWGSYAIGQLPGGVFGDRYGEGTVLVSSTLVSGAAVLLVAASVSIEMVFLASVVFGLSTALFGPIRFTVFTDIYAERAGTAVGITMSAGNVGNSLLPILAVSLAGIATWRLGFAAVSPAFLLVGMLLYWSVPARTSESAAMDGVSREVVARILEGVRQRDVLAFTVVQILMGFTYQGFVGFYPTYLVAVKDLSPAVAATVFGVFFATAIVVQPLTGFFQDAVGSKLTLLVVIGLFAAGLFVLPAVSGVVVLAGITVLLSARTGTGVVINTYIADALPPETKGAGLGLLRMAWILVGTTAPVVIGSLGDRGLFEEGFLLLAGLALVSLVAVYFVPIPEDR